MAIRLRQSINRPKYWAMATFITSVALHSSNCTAQMRSIESVHLACALLSLSLPVWNGFSFMFTVSHNRKKTTEKHTNDVLQSEANILCKHSEHLETRSNVSQMKATCKHVYRYIYMCPLCKQFIDLGVRESAITLFHCLFMCVCICCCQSHTVSIDSSMSALLTHMNNAHKHIHTLRLR